MRESTATVTERGQVTIPAEVRKVLGIGKGDRIVFALEDGKAVVKKALSLREIFGSVPALKKPLTWEQIQAIAHEEVAERYIRKMHAGNA